MKLLIDMNLSPRWARFLAAAGFEAVHWSEVGAASAPDREIMRLAREAGYVVLTNDLDFGAILASSQGEKPSVVQIRSDILTPDSIGNLGRRAAPTRTRTGKRCLGDHRT